MKQNNIIKKKNKKGFTLVETLLTLGILAVSILVTLIAYDKVSTKNKINAEVNNLSYIIKHTQNAFANSEYYNKNTLHRGDIVVQLAPENMISSDTASTGDLINHLGSDENSKVYLNTEAVSRNVKGPNNSSLFAVRYLNVDEKYCYQFIVQALPIVDSVAISWEGKIKELDGTINREDIGRMCQRQSRSDKRAISFQSQ